MIKDLARFVSYFILFISAYIFITFSPGVLDLIMSNAITGVPQALIFATIAGYLLILSEIFSIQAIVVIGIVSIVSSLIFVIYDIYGFCCRHFGNISKQK